MQRDSLQRGKGEVDIKGTPSPVWFRRFDDEMLFPPTGNPGRGPGWGADLKLLTLAGRALAMCVGEVKEAGGGPGAGGPGEGCSWLQVQAVCHRCAREQVRDPVMTRPGSGLRIPGRHPGREPAARLRGSSYQWPKWDTSRAGGPLVRSPQRPPNISRCL